MTVPEFTDAVKALRPDILIPLADLLHTSSRPVAKKQLRMVERTDDWLDKLLAALSEEDDIDKKLVSQQDMALFAPVLPVDIALQWDYLRHLAEDVTGKISGLAIYDVNLLPDLPSLEALELLPRLSLVPPASPHEVLRQISLGVDICTVPFINSISDAGIALDFSFPPRPPPPHHVGNGGGVQPLGSDMWSSENRVSLGSLVEGCECYTCTHHHRAYLQHLLGAKEMLGWNLLQIHNHRVVSDFFSGIRRELRQGGVSRFEQCRDAFLAAYDPELPKGTGQRPRARGYHLKSEMGQEKINKPAWQNFDGKTGRLSAEATDSSAKVTPAI